MATFPFKDIQTVMATLGSVSNHESLIECYTQEKKAPKRFFLLSSFTKHFKLIAYCNNFSTFSLVALYYIYSIVANALSKLSDERDFILNMFRSLLKWGYKKK